MNNVGSWNNIHSDGGGDLVTNAGCGMWVVKKNDMVLAPSRRETKEWKEWEREGCPALVEIEESQRCRRRRGPAVGEVGRDLIMTVSEARCATNSSFRGHNNKVPRSASAQARSQGNDAG